MDNVCAACNHGSRADIEIALVAGEPLDELGMRFGLGIAELRNHVRSGHWQQFVGDQVLRCLTRGSQLLDNLMVSLVQAGGSRMVGAFRAAGLHLPESRPDPLDGDHVLRAMAQWQEELARLCHEVEAVGGWGRVWASSGNPATDRPTRSQSNGGDR